MPLYKDVLSAGQSGADGLLQTDKQDPQQQAHNASLKLLQSHLLSKKRAKQAQLQPSKLLKTDKPRQSDSYWTLDEEYDPMTPNSYEILQLAQTKAQEQKLAARKSGIKIDLSILDALDRFDDTDNDYATMTRPTQGATIAPPPSLHSTNLTDSTQSQPEHSNSSQTSQQATSEKLDGRSAAARIMAKMGYKSGQGLGKDNKGTSVPLEVESTGTSVSRIVQKEKTLPALKPDECKFTRILMLQNMVGPGEVDDELEAETKEESGKYGEVLKCLIYEIPNKQVPDNEAVRIFVEFRDAKSTEKAIADLNGRYFGGRVVKATCYDEIKFNRYDLAS